MSIPFWLLYFAVVALGFTVSGLVGFGANVLALPILSCFMDLHGLVLIFATLSFINACYRVIENWHGIRWGEFRKLIAISLAGTVTGLWLFHILPEDALKILLGCFVITMAIYNLRQARQEGIQQKPFAEEPRKQKLFYHSVLLAGGVLQGAFVCGGPLFVIFCNHYYGYERQTFRGMQFGIVFLNSSLILLSNLWRHLYTTTILVQSACGVVGLLIAFWLSHVLLQRIDDKRLYQMVQIVLFCSGVSVLSQVAMRLLG